MHNDPEAWKEPRLFRPERLEEKYDPYAYLPFINGPRNCLGQNLALFEVSSFSLSPPFCEDERASLIDYVSLLLDHLPPSPRPPPDIHQTIVHKNDLCCYDPQRKIAFCRVWTRITLTLRTPHHTCFLPGHTGSHRGVSAIATVHLYLRRHQDLRDPPPLCRACGAAERHAGLRRLSATPLSA